MTRHLLIARCATHATDRSSRCWWLLSVDDPGWQCQVLGHYARKRDAEFILRRHHVTAT